MKRDFMFTFESVTEEHPDKLCDRISDAIVEWFLRHDRLDYPRIHIDTSTFSGFLRKSRPHAKNHWWA